MTDLAFDDAVRVAVGAAAAMELEVRDPAELAVVEAAVTPAVLAYAIAMVEVDAGLGPRWAAAGSDWVQRGQLLHEAVLFLLRPEATGS